MEARHPEVTIATPDYDLSTRGNELTAISEPFRREIVGALRIMHGSMASCSLVSRPAPGDSLMEALRQMGAYTALISKGENPIDLPVVQFDQIRFCDHSVDAKSFGIEAPPTLSARANQVIK